MDSRTASYYFQRYAWPEDLFPSWHPPHDLSMVIVLPAYNEPDLILAIESLSVCHQPLGHVILLVIINEPEKSHDLISKQNLKNQIALENLSTMPSWLTLKFKRLQLPPKKAGVGLARKIGMDQASRWFKKIEINGVIICFDADSTCDPNYLKTIESTYQQKQTKAAIVNYKHPLVEGSGIIPYELHLRYYVNALRFAAYPHAFQTLGSCITIDVDTYFKVGGMNTRKAGEDFYFLHKTAAITTIKEINSTTIYPSDRLSDRVPFGTGRALQGYKATQSIPTYSLQTFSDLKSYFSQRKLLFAGKKISPSPSLAFFLNENGFEEAFAKMLVQANGNQNRLDHLFYQWWDGFKILKYVHFRRDHGETMISPLNAIHQLNEVYWKKILPKSEKELLIWIREVDKNYSN
jgi:glycosyltransferase involved in cell wall biosynthesis